MNMKQTLQMIRFRFICLIVILLLSKSGITQNTNCNLQNGNLVVTTTNDAGPGSLRNAIECANSLPGSNRIIFNIGNSGRQIIYIGSSTGQPLPALTDAGTVIDATTQNGDVTRPRIVLDGSRTQWNVPINGVFIQGNNSQIYGLEIRNFPGDGIEIFNAQNVIIGAPNRGNVIYGNGEETDFYPNASPNGPWEGSGILLRNESKFCQIQSNVIGTDAAFVSNLGNEYCGILIQGQSSNNIIGGNSIDTRNIIAHNPIGVRIDNSEVCSIFSNGIFCNDQDGIQFSNGGNSNKTAPQIEIATTQTVAGKSNPQDLIELFVNTSSSCQEKPCQGRVFIGRVTTLRDSTWSFNVTNLDFAQFDLLTATATDAQGNTSSFAPCRTLISTTTTCANAQGIITVTNTNDDGVGSLRAAIDCANSTAGANIIRFDIPGNNRHTIFVGSTTGQPLPALTDIGTVIDATTQTGFGSNNNYEPKIIIDGSQYTWNFPHNAIFIRANNCAVYGLEIRNFPDDGIDITAAQFVTIGAPKKGNVIYNCGIAQDFFDTATPKGPWEGCGIVLKRNTANCKVSSNIIGTNYDRTITVGNEFCGISFDDAERNNIIGGATQEEGNIIAYNSTGIILESPASNIQIVKNSFICNDTVAIALIGTANQQKSAPLIKSFTSQQISGTATVGDIIEVFISSTSICPNQPCQGQTYLGTATTNNTGNWTLLAPFANNINLASTAVITATATDNQGNTSAFANCFTTNTTTCSNLKASILNTQGATCDQNNGTFSVSVTGGTAPYLYDIGRGATLSPNFSNLNAGTYAVTITDANNCQATQAIKIERVPRPSVIITDQENAICGQSTGAFTVVPLQGLPPYTYNIGNGTTSDAQFDNLASGIYTITVTDASGCTATETITIAETETVKLTITDITDASCGQNNGRVTATVTGGIAPITYKIGEQVYIQPVFDNLAEGIYTVTATDANGCTAVHDFTIKSSPLLTLSVASIQKSDCSQRGGAITVQTTGGTAPILFNYGNGITANPTFSNLFAGTYLITATDAKGCTAVTTARVEAGAPFEVMILDLQDASCGLSNASFSVSVQDGQAPYRYALNGQPSTTSSNFQQISPGQYTLTVTDERGCTVTKELTINAIAPPSLNVVNVTDANCATGGGSFSIFLSGGVLPVVYDIGTEQTSNPNFANLLPNTYTLKATDALGCTATREVEINLVGALELEDLQIDDATCGINNGSFEIKVKSGTAPYQYNIGTGNSANGLFTDLAAGTYNITVTDALGCSRTDSLTIGSSNQMTASVLNLEAATCGSDNGSFDVKVETGIAPYRYDIGNGFTSISSFSNLAVGGYEVTVEDGAGCTVTVETEIISSSNAVSATVNDLQIATCGRSNGSFTVNATAGVAPFSYNIGSGNVPNNIFLNLGEGVYQLVVTDANGCKFEQEVLLEETPPVTVDVVSKTKATCGAANGAFQIEVSTGLAPYSYNIGREVVTNPLFTGLQAGSYTVTITDANACTAIQTVIIEAELPLLLELKEQTIGTCQNLNSSFAITAVGGIAPYTFTIPGTSNNTGVFQNLPNGNYTVTVTDATNCQATIPVNLTTTTALNVQLLSQRRPSCGQPNGIIIVSANGGATPYSYKLGNNTFTSPTFENLSAGNYLIKVIDKDGCEASLTVDLPAETVPPVVRIEDKKEASCRQPNGSFTLNVTGGLAPYTYNLGQGATVNPQFSNLAANTYALTITDANDCAVIQVVNVVAAPVLELTVQDVENIRCGLSNGSFRINATGGTPPYSYNIGTGAQEGALFTNLSKGDYTVTVTDARACIELYKITIGEAPSLTATIGNRKDATCGNTNGGFTATPLGGKAPYSYNIGRGITTNSRFDNLAAGRYELTITDAENCQATVPIEIKGSLAPTVAISQVSEATCAGSTGSFQLTATGGTAPYTYDIGNGASTRNSFTDLSAGQYTVTTTDANGCAVTTTVNINSNGDVLPTARFTFDTTTANIQFINTSINADSITWNLGDGTSSNQTNITHTYNTSGSYTICLIASNNCGADTLCQEVNVKVVSSDVAEISGQIYDEMKQSVEGVSINCTGNEGVVTNLSGSYIFENLAIRNTYTIRPEKKENLLNGVSTYDIFLLNSHILTNDTLDSPYKIIAADINKSGSVTTFDMLSLRRILLGLDTILPGANTSWRFINANFQFEDPLYPFSTPFPEETNLNLNRSYRDVDFVAVKVGDLNNSAVLSATSIEPRSKQAAQMPVRVSPNEDQITFSIPSTWLGLQFTLEYDPEQIEIRDWHIGNLEGLTASNFAWKWLPTGKITVSWNATEHNRLGNELLTLDVIVNKAIDWKSAFKITSSITDVEVFTSTTFYHAIELDFIAPQHNQSKDSDSLSWSLLEVTPNPFYEQCQLKLFLPKAETIRLSLYDAAGRQIEVRWLTLEAGHQSVFISSSHLPTGMIYYRLDTASTGWAGWLVRGE